MTRIMYDSTNIYDIPASAVMVGYYVDGLYAVSASIVKARFPKAVLVPISAIGSNNGIVGDVEPGCMTVGQSINWVKMRRLAGVDPTIYCNEMNAWAGIRQAFKNAGVVEPHYWVADYDNVAVVPAGAVAKQYANPTITGGHYDKSIVADIWPGVDINMADLDRMQLLLETLAGRFFGVKGSIPVDQQELDAILAKESELATTAQLNQAVADLKEAIAKIPQGVPDHTHNVATTGPMEL